MVSCPTPYKKIQPNGKSLPYPIYTARTNLDVHVQVFRKAIQANGEKNDDGIVNLFIFTHHDAMYPNGEKIYESKSNLQIWGIGGYTLEALSKSVNRWTSVHGITNDKTRQRQKGLLWTYILKLANYL